MLSDISSNSYQEAGVRSSWKMMLPKTCCQQITKDKHLQTLNKTTANSESVTQINMCIKTTAKNGQHV